MTGSSFHFDEMMGQNLFGRRNRIPFLRGQIDNKNGGFGYLGSKGRLWWHGEKSFVVVKYVETGKAFETRSDFVVFVFNVQQFVTPISAGGTGLGTHSSLRENDKCIATQAKES